MTPPANAIHDWIRKGLQFRGRSSRSDYWWTRVVVLTLNLVLLFVFLASIGPDLSEALVDWLTRMPDASAAERTTLPFEWQAIPALGKFALIFMIVFAILTFIPDLSLSWRRFQDMNLPGWLHLLFVIGGAYLPFMTIIELIWFIRRGTQGENPFGPDPVIK